MKKYIISLLIILAAASCSKVIDIDYPTIDPLYVAVASLSADGGSVRLTQTTPMEEPMQETPITSAAISISCSSGEKYDFAPDSDGIYQVVGNVSLRDGDDYTLTIDADNEQFSSISRLAAKPEISDMSFSMQEFMEGMNLVFCSVQIANPAEELNYYRYRFRYFEDLEEEEPAWMLAKETFAGQPTVIAQPIINMERKLVDGDKVTFEIQAIDKRVYDYLFSLSLNGSSSTNPIPNFSGGCLGYFSAYSLTTKAVEFYYADLKDSMQ